MSRSSPRVSDSRISPILVSTNLFFSMLARHMCSGRPVVADWKRTKSAGVWRPSPSGRSAFRYRSAARPTIAISSRAGIARSESRARCASRMSRGIIPGTARPTRASSSPVSKCTTGSDSRLVYGWPQRSTGMFNMMSSVDPHRRDRGVRLQGPHAADAVPGIRGVGRLALALVALQEARHEELLGQRREPDPARLPVLDDALGVVRVDDLDHRPRLRRVVADLVAVPRADGLRGREAHHRVAVDGRDVHAVEQLLDGEARPLGRELGAAGEDAGDA